MFEKIKSAFVIAEPDPEMIRRVRLRRRRIRKNDVERSVVIEISYLQPRISSQIIRNVRHRSNLSRFPALTLVLVRDANDRSVRFDRQQIKYPVVVGIGNGYRFNRRDIRRQRSLSKLSLPFIDENVQASTTIDDCGIRISVAIEVCPGEPEQTGNPQEWMDCQESIVTVVS